DRYGQSIKTVEPLGRTTTYTRVNMQPVLITQPSGATETLTYDVGNGLVMFDSVAGHASVTIGYGFGDRPIVIQSLGSAWQDWGYTTKGYDSIYVLGFTDTTKYYPDARGRDTMIVDALGHTTHLHYDGTFGNLDSAITAGSRWGKTRFDGYGRD